MATRVIGLEYQSRQQICKLLVMCGKSAKNL